MIEDNLFVQQQPEKNQIHFATVAEVYEDGLSLLFDGEEAPSEKHYRCNAFVVFRKGDRVRIIEDSGTYVAEYPVGVPKTTFVADSAETARSAETAKKADSVNKASSADKLTYSRNIKLTGAVTGSGSFDGSGDLSISTQFSGTADVYSFNTKHTGSRLAFFNGAITTKRTVTALTSPSSASASTIAAKLNELINALKAYSLV